MIEQATWTNHYRATVRYGGSLMWLLFWLIVLFPIAIVLFFTKFSFVNGSREIEVVYSGSRMWLCFWTILFFPVAIILGLVNGFEVNSRPKMLIG